MDTWRLQAQSVTVIGALLVGMGAGGCVEDPDMPDGMGMTDTDTGGGLGETGDEPVLSRSCLAEPVSSRFGYKHQCSGDIALEIVVDGPFDGAPASDGLALEFGPGVVGDSYESPHVMACCPQYDDSAPNCGQPHERFCMADLAEQGCKSMESNLRDFADDAFGGASIADAAKRAAVHKIADYVREHQDQCITAFVGSTGVVSTLPTCDADDNGVDYGSLLESGSWSFDPPGLVSNVQISVVQANYTGVHPTEGFDECSSADDNDGVLFLEIDPDPDSEILYLAAGAAALEGPAVEGSIVQGSGELGSEASGCQPGTCSTLAILVDPVSGLASLENLELHAAGSVEVGTEELALSVDGFALRLWDSTPALLDAEDMALEIPPSAAWFAASGQSGASPGVVNATNETALVLTKTADGWTSSAFTIGHENALGHWTLTVSPAQWH